MTLDGFCDHTTLMADEEIHQHYADLLSNGGKPCPKNGRTGREIILF